MNEFNPILALGLMSGTSADGVDAALLLTDGESQIEFLDALTLPYENTLHRRLIEAAQSDIPLVDVLHLERDITRVHIRACNELQLQSSRDVQELVVVGFHGHTIRHDARNGVTWQLGNASLLASRTEKRVVSDFRRADIAQGGQGAPLAPLFHQNLLEAVEKPTLVLNLGGVANITWLGKNGAISAGDTGPGCGLLDAWVTRRAGQIMDEDGLLALTGTVDDELVRRALDHEYFQRDFPKSADRFEFDFVDVNSLSTKDGAATLCALTVQGVAAAVDRMPERPKHCWVTGGGSKHPVMMKMLRERLGHAEPIEALGFSGDHLEAQCFAWLAVRRLRGLPTSLPETTGCERATCGGSVTEPG